MNSNWFKIFMKMTKVKYGKNLVLKGVPVIFNKGGAKLVIDNHVITIESFITRKYCVFCYYLRYLKERGDLFLCRFVDCSDLINQDMEKIDRELSKKEIHTFLRR